MLRTAVLAATLAATLAWAAPLAAYAQASTGTQTVDVMNKLWGKHAGLRANHAKGVVVLGMFTPTPAARKLSKAAIFAGAAVPVTVRFSDSTGLPAIPDGAAGANPHGMAIEFRPGGADQVHVVTNSLPFFPVSTGEQFLALLTAISESGPTAAKPTAFDRFVAAHPTVPAAFGAVHTPSSFAREQYNGIDAFVFVNASGKRQPFRFRLVPVAGTDYMTPAAAAAEPGDFLIDELPARIARSAVKFHLMAQLAEAADQTTDPARAWPAGRKMVDMGTIALTSSAADQVQAARDLHLLPSQLEPGIEVSDDPLISARVAAYVISFGRRAE
jgi:catalase